MSDATSLELLVYHMLGKQSDTTLQKPAVVANSTFTKYFWPLQSASEVTTCSIPELQLCRHRYGSIVPVIPCLSLSHIVPVAHVRVLRTIPSIARRIYADQRPCKSPTHDTPRRVRKDLQRLSDWGSCKGVVRNVYGLDLESEDFVVPRSRHRGGEGGRHGDVGYGVEAEMRDQGRVG